ncbi:hypothetical protein JMF89_12345 [Clostridiaceae bacterium UIB06]|uniref:SH3b domain-containing protein n=1 Tax=Clostridium thailandense TaxID=2794346 RepID=A0A949TWF9_9CLOT|nr:hypothetical protein [Clostridium thailandense]MBV7274841.1 hypothetical protein [Clostridium thailandense]MCH5137989.1 hypothetical protein [Clostridiaceae bacterium UIB06]
MKKNIKQTFQIFTLIFIVIGFYSFVNISNVRCTYTNKVYASDIYNTSNTVQVENQIIVYTCPSNSKTVVGFVKNQQIKILSQENSYYYIEYTFLGILKRGYVEQNSLPCNLQIPIADYSRTKQVLYLNKSTSVYDGPSDAYTRLDKINGQKVFLLNEENNWCFIEYTFSGKIKRGYINSNSIIMNSSTNSLPAPVDLSSLDPKIKTLFSTARSEIGFIGSGKNGNITKYGLWYGVDDIPWSTTFLSWVADRSNLQDVIPKAESYSDSLNWFKSRHLWENTPKVGAIVFFKDKDVDYAGIVEAINNDDTITILIGGYPVSNSKQVTRITIKSKNNLIAGYGYPQYSLSGLGYSQQNGQATIYSGPSDQYSQTGTIDNEMVKLLNKEGDFFFIEYNNSGVKSRGYISSSYVPTDSKIATVDYTNNKKSAQVTALTTVYEGPSKDYATNGFIENQQVTILNKEDNWYLIEYTTANVKKRGYAAVDNIKILVISSTNTTKKLNAPRSNSGGTTDIGNYVYKFTDAIITSYDHSGCGAAGENYYCDGSGKIVAAHNMRAGTVIYIPDLKYINSTGIFTVGDTGGPFFDFDINTNQDVDKGPHDVYVLSWGDGPMMQSFDAAKQEQIRYGQWNRFKSMYENYKFQTENFTQP